jgi:prepilin-type N-terminal cleavage/methylation domain-containing protein
MRKFREMLVGGNKGFTLIELLVVIAVLGILAGIAVPRIMGIRDEAEKGALKANANTFSNAMEMYYARYGNYPDVEAKNLGELTGGTFDDLNITFSSDTDAKINTAITSGQSYSTTLEDSNGNTITVSSSGISEVNMATN